MTNQESEQKNIPNEESLRKQLKQIQPLLKILFENRKRFFWFNIVIAVIAVIFVLFGVNRSYLVTVDILPDYGNKINLSGGLSGLSGIASFAGINLGGEPATDVYKDLLTSESVLSPIIYSHYKTEKYDHPVNLIEYWDYQKAVWLPDSLQERYRLVRAIQHLTKCMRIEIDRETRILTVQLKMEEGRLAADVINSMMESLDNYLRTKKKSYASNQRFYIEKRLEQVKDSLKTAEEELVEFREHNKIFDLPPKLQLIQTRFARNVEIQQTIYMELMRQIELVKIEEIRDIPVLNINELSQNPAVPSSMSRRNQFMIIMFLSIVGSAIYFIYESKLKRYWRIFVEETLHSFRNLTV